MAANTGRPSYDDEEALRVVLRIRGLLAQGYRTSEIATLTGRSETAVSLIKHGKRYQNPRIPILFLQPRKPQPGEKCTNCLREPRLLSKDNTCMECSLISLNRLGFLKIGEPKSKEDAKNEPQKN